MKNFNSMMEDLYTSEYKIKKWVDPVTGETKERKVRPKRIDFEASQLRGQPAQKETEGLNMKESFKGTPSVRTNHYSWGTMKTIHSGADFNIPLHPEHHKAIAKLENEQEHHFKTEDGKHWTARRKGADVHFQGANGGNSAVVSHASMREATEDDLRNELHEVLSADANAGDWIHDFVHSTNPKFAGKSKKERIKMALGAYYGKKLKEETDSEEDIKMAKIDLATIMNHVKRLEPHLDKEMDLPEWVESKITLAADYIGCVADYIEASQQVGVDEAVQKKKPSWLLAAELNAEKKEGKLKEAKEGSAEDKKQDKAGMKRTGMTVKQWEKSAEDKKEDMQESEGSWKVETPWRKTTGSTTDKSGATHTPMSRARHLARAAISKQYSGLEKEPKKSLPTAMVKASKNAVDGDTVEGWDDPKKAVKESLQKVDVPAYLRKAKGEKPLELKDLKRKDTLSDAENLKAARGVKEGVSFADFKMMLEARTQYVVKLSHPDTGHVMNKNYTADKGEDDYDIKRRAQVEHGGKGYNVDHVRKKDIDAYDSEDDENAEKSSTTKRGRGRPAGAKSGARGPRIK